MNDSLPAQVLIDPSFVAVLFDEDDEPRKTPTFLVPGILRPLIEKAREDASSRRDLVHLLKTFDPTFGKKSIHAFNWDLFFSRATGDGTGWKFRFLQADEVDQEVAKAVESAFNDIDGFEVTLSPPRNLLGAVFGELLGASKKLGHPIVFKSTKWLKHAQDRLPMMMAATKNRATDSILKGALIALDFAARCDHVVETKHQFVAAKFKFPGAKSTKFLIGAALTTAGLFTANTPLSIAGITFAFLDP